MGDLAPRGYLIVSDAKDDWGLRIPRNHSVNPSITDMDVIAIICFVIDPENLMLANLTRGSVVFRGGSRLSPG